MKIPDSERTINDPFDQSCFYKIEKSNNCYFPLDFVKLVFVSPDYHEFFHKQDEETFQKGNK